MQRTADGWLPIFATGGGPVGLATDGTDLWVSNYSQCNVYKVGSITPVATNLIGSEGLAYYTPENMMTDGTTSRL